MLFNSLHFVLFFVVVTTLYFLVDHKYRWFLLLVSSCYFYMVFVPVYILILGFTIVVDYFAGIFLEKTEGRKKKIFLIASISANVGVLAFFKYYNFINDNITSILYGMGYHNPVPYLSILLPVGLSFHTFKAMSYTIEIYRGRQKAEKNFGIYALYEMFYPQLVAGPIERPQNLIHQLHEKHSFDYNEVVGGLKLILWGLFKKIVIADRLAIYVNTIYNNPDSFGGITLFIATIFFAFQVYCDFSGYSDVAMGTARVMGFKLTINFNRPFFSKNITEFWSRWHVSLSSWLRDYLFLPLSYKSYALLRNLSGKKIFGLPFNTAFLGYASATLITMFIAGLWHGASWIFVIWGSIHGIYLVMAFGTKKIRHRISIKANLSKYPRSHHFFQVVVTFCFFCFSIIFFRANSIEDAFVVITKILTFSGSIWYKSPSMLIFSFLGILFLLLVEIKQEFYKGKFSFLENPNWAVRNLSYAILVIMILLFGVFDGGQFIYFQF